MTDSIRPSRNEIVDEHGERAMLTGHYADSRLTPCPEKRAAQRDPRL
jgi:hypothetical protein